MSELRYRLAGSVGRRVLDTLLATMRVSFQDTQHAPDRSGEPVIFALWHGRLLPLTYLYRRQGIATLASRSTDGEYIARVLRGWGYCVERGSSSRGGSAGLRGLVRAAREGRSLAFTPDGPRGPAQRMKPGVITAAQLTGLPIIPLSAAAERAWWFTSWDRFLVPKPFARVWVRYGAPQHVPRDADPAALERAARRLENALNRLTSELDDVARRGGDRAP